MANPQAGTLPTDVRNLIGVEPRHDSDQQLLERYVRRRDEDAFAGLVRRHGNTVWGVCRRVLQQPQDAEDAFQATFLILARKAASIRKGEAVGSWLHGVAYRTALKARRSSLRREQGAAGNALRGVPIEARMEPSASSEAACRELQRILDEEVQRLPAKFRAPFVLCCLEGMSRAEAAQELGWKEGTLSGRLAQARKLLENRLVRRGITFSAVLTAVALAQNAASAAPPAALIENTPQAVLPPGSGKVAATTLSPAVFALAGSLVSGSVTLGVALLLGLALLIGGGILAASRLGSDSHKQLKVQATAVPVAARPATPAPRPGPVFDAMVAALAFSPDGKRLVTVGARPEHPGHLKIYDVETARELLTLPAIPGTSSVVFAPDGQTLVSGEFSGAVKLRDPATGKEQASWLAHPTGVRSLAFAPDGASLLSGGADGTAKLWDVKTHQERQLLQGHSAEVVAAAYFHHGKGLVTASRDQTAVLWDAETGQQRFTLRGHEDAVEAVAVAPDDILVATGAKNGTVRLWNAETGKAVANLEGADGTVGGVAFSPDGKLLAAAADRTIHFWNVQTHQRIASLPRQTRPISTLAFSPASNFLASGGPLGLMLFALQVDGDDVHLRKAPAQEFYRSLKGPENCQGLERFGPDAESCVRFEPEGLRITLPAGRPGELQGTGVMTTFPIKGDFEITVSYEVLQEPRPAESPKQTRFSLGVLLDTPRLNMATLSYTIVSPGSRIATWVTVWNEKTGEQKHPWKPIYTAAKKGRLHLVRTGSLLDYYRFAEGVDKEFTLLDQYSFAADDVKDIRLVASTGGPKATFDIRLTDLRIRAGSIPELPGDSVPAPPSRWKIWLAGAILGLALLLVLGLWLLRRRGRLAEQEVEPASDQDEPGQEVVSFPCPDCGKDLKARTALAGKKIRCPGCGKIVCVPL